QRVEAFVALLTRALLLDARASMAAAPGVAAVMARELDRDTGWQQEQVKVYQDLASKYLMVTDKNI
ncbi:MAG: hypothetical protein JJV98_10315, partial [Desulfosarcina sp.]|nr:hypothetical protein [Desulfobacterales bacterium]